MLEEVRIRGLGVIDDAVLPLGPGLTVVTGETGAGKTMVVTGLLLLFGARVDATRVRAGQAQASVEGRLDLEPESAAAQRVTDAGGDLDDGRGLVLRRVVASGGRSRAFVGGASAPVSVLGELADSLLAVHGQSDQIRLARPGEQRRMLDRFAGIDLTDFQHSYEHWRAAAAAVTDRTSRAAELRREADLLAHGIAEIEAAAPHPDELGEVVAAATRLASADALRLAARTAQLSLVGAEDPPDVDVLSLLGPARKAVQQQAGADPELDALASRLVDIAALTADLGADLSRYLDALDADPDRLAQLESRRAQLSALVRKYSDHPDGGLAEVLRWADAARERLAGLDVSDEAIAALVAERDAAAAVTAERAEQIRGLRTAAAEKLAAMVGAELAGLAMPAARVTIAVRARPPTSRGAGIVIAGQPCGVGPDGADEVDLLFQAQPAAPALPIGRGASGGELSRVMLALEVCLAGSEPVPTMVFDEVDAGVGGRAAIEVGRRLARLARDHQVLVVTHLPQVAAFADRHVVVDRPGGAGPPTAAGVTASDIRVVEGPDRVSELARMLAGTDSATAREHATELLADAARDRAEPASAEPASAESGGQPPAGRAAGKPRVRSGQRR